MMGPYRESHSIGLYEKKFDDGRFETTAFFDTTINGWSPMIAVWACDLDENPNEDIISFNGMHYAYCISDEKPSDFEGLKAIDDPQDATDPVAMLVIGSLMRRVI